MFLILDDYDEMRDCWQRVGKQFACHRHPTRGRRNAVTVITSVPGELPSCLDAGQQQRSMTPLADPAVNRTQSLTAAAGPDKDRTR
jgi:hypothetical protein